MDAKNVGDPTEAPAQEWGEITAELDKGDFMMLDSGGPSHFTTWLTTINDVGSPHVTAVGAVWDGSAFWFQTADHTRKARNVVRDARCTISVTVGNADVVIDGTAAKVTHPADVARVAEIWANRGGWPVTPDESGTGITAPFNAPGLGPPPWYVYRITPRTATSCTMEGQSTIWTFD